MEIIIILAVLTFLFWMAYHITGALLSAAVWLLLKLPVAVFVFSLGMMCCITLLLIPIGLKCFRVAKKILF